MYRNSLFDNPIAIFIFVVFASVVNTLMSVHFISIFFVGVLFLAFIRSLDKGYYYTLFFIVMGFCMIEIAHGFRLFNLSLLSFFLYFFIVPFLKSILSSVNFYFVSLILVFYMGFALLLSIFGGIDSELISILIMNYIIDIILVSIIL